MSDVAGERRGGRGRVLVLGLAVLLFALGIALLAAGPALFRMGLVERSFARFDLAEVAMYVMAAAVAVGLAGLVYSLVGKKQRGAIVAVLVMMAAGVGAGTLYAQTKMKDQLPPINDVQTDWSRPWPSPRKRCASASTQAPFACATTRSCLRAMATGRA